MDIELGIMNVSRPVSFSTDMSAEEVSATIDTALKTDTPINVIDSKGRHIIVPSGALGYAIVGSDTAHPVGFGAL